jgi:hypothetical protein
VSLRVGMPDSPTDRHHIEASRDERGRVGVPQGVERYSMQLQSLASRAPQPRLAAYRCLVCQVIGTALGLVSVGPILIVMPRRLNDGVDPLPMVRAFSRVFDVLYHQSVPLAGWAARWFDLPCNTRARARSFRWYRPELWVGQPRALLK